jgi:hypothetical protein
MKRQGRYERKEVKMKKKTGRIAGGGRDGNTKRNAFIT